MKKYLLLAFLFIITSSLFSLTISMNMSFDGVTRNFLVHLYPGYNVGQHPALVFNLHGYGSDAAQQEFYSRMSETSDSNHFIVIYPNGLSNSWNSGFSGTGAYGTGTDDVGFISKIIDTINQLYNIDFNRVYSCGMSNGGYQSYRLACDLETRIAAIASVAGAVTDSVAYHCVQSRNVPVMEIHGTADPLVPYNGTAGELSTEQGITFWLNKDQCSNISDTTNLPDINILDSSNVQRIDYTACVNSEVVLYKIAGGGHTWPNAYYDYIYGPTNRDLDASQEIWNFFNRYTLNGLTGIEEIKKETEVKIYPNPFSDELKIEATQKIEKIEVLNILGERVLQEKIFALSATLVLSSLERGIYFMRTEGKNYSAVSKVVRQ